MDGFLFKELNIPVFKNVPILQKSYFSCIMTSFCVMNEPLFPADVPGSHVFNNDIIIVEARLVTHSNLQSQSQINQEGKSICVLSARTRLTRTILSISAVCCFCNSQFSKSYNRNDTNIFLA
jgi:hypothetical protein